MQRYALAALGPTPEQIVVAIPNRASHWTLAQRNRGLHRLLVPISSSLRALDAMRYIIEELGKHLVGVHVVNVQSPLMAGDITPLVTAKTITSLREAAGERILAVAREAFADSGMPVTGEVAFGPPAETICRIAEERACTGIVIGRNGRGLHDLIRGSVAANVLRLATVPVTVVNARTAAAVVDQQARQPGTTRHRRVTGAVSRAMRARGECPDSLGLTSTGSDARNRRAEHA